MYNYSVLPHENLAVIKLEGDLVVDDYFGLKEKISEDQSFRPDNSLVLDFRNSRILFSLDELKQVADVFPAPDSLKGRMVMLVNHSVDTAKLLLFRSHIGNRHHIQIVSTVEAASSYLGRDLFRYLDDNVGEREDFYLT